MIKRKFDFMHFIQDKISYHEDERKRSLSLIASENILSQDAKKALSSDLASRYSSRFYGGTKYNREIINYTEELAKELFNVKFACVSPISGHLSVLAAVNGLTKVGDKISIVDPSLGGYPININALGRKQCSFPFDKSKWNNDESKIVQHFEEHKPKLTIIGSSVIPFRYKLKTIVEIAHPDNNLIYDASHVLGLIAGGKFQNPLDEGFHTMVGSTHKSFPGPQGGIILSNDRDTFEKLTHQFSIQTHDNPFGKNNGTILVDNVHSNRIAALGISITEMQVFGRKYAQQVVNNANALGNEINKLNMKLKMFKHPNQGFTHSHQIISPMDPQHGMEIKNKLEECGILVDSFLRIGTAEITRRGITEKYMPLIAELIKEAYYGRFQEDTKQRVAALSNEFNDENLSYIFH